MGRVRDLARGSAEAYMEKFKDEWAQKYPGWSA
jgi:glycyl-tRNA synthetase alpha chain